MTATVTRQATTLEPRRFTTDEFYRLAEVGILGEEERLELVGGEIVKMAAIGINHANALDAVTNVLAPFVGPDVRLRVQSPIRVGGRDGFQPDATLLRRGRRGRHPSPEDVYLVVEVADSSLDHDRNTKFPSYAAAGIAEAWLVDIRAWAIERHTEPREGRYSNVAVARRGESLHSTILPAIAFAVDDVFALVEGMTGRVDSE